MATLDELNLILNESGDDQANDFFQQFGESQEKVLKNFNTGIARLFGLPRLATDLLEKGENKLLDFIGLDKLIRETDPDEPSILPTGEQVQSFAAEKGLAFAPGEEPQDVTSRIVQNIGTTGPLLPLLGPAAVVPELLAATFGAIGGKVLEGTEFSERHPVLARAIGEIGGGLSPTGVGILASFFSRGGVIGAVSRAGGSAVSKGRGIIPKTEARVSGRLRELVPSKEGRTAARGELSREKVPLRKGILSVGEASGDPKLASLSRTVEAEDIVFAEQRARQRILAGKELRKQFTKSGDVDDAREFLESVLTAKANAANTILKRVTSSSDPATLSTKAEEILRSGLESARRVETEVWNQLPSGERARGLNLIATHREILNDVTTGGDLSQVSAFARGKLGTLKKVKVKTNSGVKVSTKLRGGTFFNEKITENSAKSIHKFYSDLGREVAVLSRQPGTSNKIRIINNLREAALNDLADAGLSEPYIRAIEFSADLNRKFTSGDVGKLLGFAGGKTQSSARALEVLIGRGGQKGNEAIQQALKAAPEVRREIEDFIKTQFATVAKDTKTNVINSDSGNKFIENFNEILTDIFPGLKSELESVVKRQVDVDEFIGVSQRSQISPLLREKSAVSMFLKSNVNEEMKTFLNTSLNRRDILTNLVLEVKKDKTGRAFAGLQNAFTEEILRLADDGITVNGKIILSKINKLAPDIIRAKLFTPQDIKSFRRVGDIYEKIAFELKQKPLPGGIIDDLPGNLQTNLLKIFAVRSLGFIKKKLRLGSGIGSSLQEAQITSGTAARLSKDLVSDEARNAIILAIKDPELMADLLKNIEAMPLVAKEALVKRVISKVRNITEKAKKLGVSGVVKEAGTRTVRKLKIDKPRAGAVVPPIANIQSDNITGNDESELQGIMSEIDTLLGRKGLSDKDNAIANELGGT